MSVTSGALLDWISRHNRTIRIGAVLFTLVIAGSYALRWGTTLRFLDERDYVAISHNLANGRGFSIAPGEPTAYRAPAYPLLLAVVRLGGLSITGLRLINVVLLATTVWLAFALAEELTGPVAGSFAAAGCALYPLSIFSASTFYPETLATTLLVAALLCAFRADKASWGQSDTQQIKRRLGGAGLLFSLLFLTMPILGVVALVTFGWYGWRHRQAALPGLAWAALLFVLPVVPWTVRNAVELHAFVPSTTVSGVNLILGNSQNATYGSGVDTDIERYRLTVVARHLDEVAADAYLRDEALRYIGDHPARSLRLWAEKSLNYFSATNRLSTKGESSDVRNLVAMATYYPLLLLLAIRLALSRSAPLLSGDRVLTALYLLMAPVMGIFFTRVRYRAPLDVLLFVVLAVGATTVLRTHNGGDRGSLVDDKDARATGRPAGQ